MMEYDDMMKLKETEFDTTMPMEGAAKDLRIASSNNDSTSITHVLDIDSCMNESLDKSIEQHSETHSKSSDQDTLMDELAFLLNRSESVISAPQIVQETQALFLGKTNTDSEDMDPSVIEFNEQEERKCISSGQSESMKSEDSLVLEESSKEDSKGHKIKRKRGRPPKYSSGIMCSFCGKLMSTIKTLKEHKKLAHPEKVRQTRIEVACREENCHYIGSSIAKLQMHLEVDHGLHFDCCEMKFRDFEHFSNWLHHYEQDTNCSFAAITKWEKSRHGSLKTFYCNRTGKYKSKATLRQRDKSIKVGGHCTARVRVLKCVNQSVTAHMVKTHYAHKLTATLRKRHNLPLEKRALDTNNILDSLAPKIDLKPEVIEKMRRKRGGRTLVQADTVINHLFILMRLMPDLCKVKYFTRELEEIAKKMCSFSVSDPTSIFSPTEEEEIVKCKKNRTKVSSKEYEMSESEEMYYSERGTVQAPENADSYPSECLPLSYKPVKHISRFRSTEYVKSSDRISSTKQKQNLGPKDMEGTRVSHDNSSESESICKIESDSLTPSVKVISIQHSPDYSDSKIIQFFPAHHPDFKSSTCVIYTPKEDIGEEGPRNICGGDSVGYISSKDGENVSAVRQNTTTVIRVKTERIPAKSVETSVILKRPDIHNELSHEFNLKPHGKKDNSNPIVNSISNVHKIKTRRIIKNNISVQTQSIDLDSLVKRPRRNVKIPERFTKDMLHE